MTNDTPSDPRSDEEQAQAVEQAAAEAAEAVEELSGLTGQAYHDVDYAFELLVAFAPFVQPEYVDEHTVFDEEEASSVLNEDVAIGERSSLGRLALSEALADAQTTVTDARGILNALPHEVVVTAAKVSAIAVEAVGSEPSDYTAGGHGFTADGRHRENCDALKQLFLVETDETEE